MAAWTELLLYEAARAQMVTETIKPALQANTVVICDRFYDSTTAYQGYGRQLDLELVSQANKLGACGLVPDITFLLDLEPTVAFKRKQSNGDVNDRIEDEDRLFYNRVRKGYLEITRTETRRVIRIDGNRSINIIHDEIMLKFAGLTN